MIKILHIILFSILSLSFLKAQQIKAIAEENLFLSTDREVYFPEEEIYVKIWQNYSYGFNPSGLGYIELLSASNEIVSQKTIKLKKDGAGVIIKIPGTLPSGFYILRAYTSWLKNYGPDYFAYRKLMILNPLLNNHFNFPSSKKYSGKTVRVNFFPEGGFLERGVNNRVYAVFENLPENSLKGAYLTGERMDTIAALNELDKNTAYFDFVPYYGKYELKIPKIYPHRPLKLPEANDLSAKLSYSLSLERINFIVQKTDTLLDFSDLMIEMQNINNRENNFAVIENLLEDPYIELKNIPGGLNRFLLKDENGRILSELFYLKEESRHLRIKRVNLKESYSPHDSVSPEVIVFDHDDNPAASYLNIYVRKKKENVLGQTGIRDYMAYGNYLHLKPGWNYDSEVHRSAISAMYGPSLFVDNPNKLADSKFKKEDQEFVLGGKYSNGKIDNHEIYFSFPGDSGEIFITKTDKDGRFSFSLPIYGERESFIKTCDSINEGFLMVDDSFYPEYLKFDDFPQDFDSAMMVHFNKWYESWQINYYFTIRGKETENVRNTMFYDKADFYISMKNYIDFPNMEEVFFEIVKPAMIFDQNKNPYLKIISRNTNRTIGKRPLYVVDGIPFTDPGYAMKLDPNQVRDIAVIARRYFIGPQVYDGIVIINTYDNNLSAVEPEMVFLRKDIVFPERSVEFRIQPQPELKNEPFRPSLFCWISSAQSAENGKISFSFITPDENGQYEIYIEAFDPVSRTFGSNTFDFQVSD